MDLPLSTLALAVTTSLAGLSAQSFSSPRGLLGTEGDASHFALFDPAFERFMQIDDSQRGHPAPGLHAIAFRRDGDIASIYGTPRSVTLTVRVGLADYATASGTFANNWAAAPTTVFTPKPVNVPDWTTLAPTRPAPFDLVVPFDVTWSFDGSRALAFELVMQNTQGISSPEVDADRGAALPYVQAVGTTYDYGCLVTGQPLEMAHSLTLENYGPNHAQYGIRIGTAVVRAPRSQPCVLNLDVTDPNLVIPGLCAPVHALPLASLSLGNTSVAGDTAAMWFNLPFDARLQGIGLYTQAIALDPQGHAQVPIALSNRRHAVIPDAPHIAPQCAYLYAPRSSDPSATLWTRRGVIVRFD